jgi:hypothetical protein
MEEKKPWLKTVACRKSAPIDSGSGSPEFDDEDESSEESSSQESTSEEKSITAESQPKITRSAEQRKRLIDQVSGTEQTEQENSSSKPKPQSDLVEKIHGRAEESEVTETPTEKGTQTASEALQF